MEKFLSFSVGSLKFVDSNQFLSASLAELVDNLKKGGIDSFENMTGYFPESEDRELLLRKGVYPYEYMNSVDRFAETKFPEKKCFFDRLRNQ